MVKFTKAKPSGLGWQVKKTEKRQIIPAPQKLENVNKLGGLAPEVEKPTARDANLGFYANGLCINLPILRICVHRAPCGVTCSPPAKKPGRKWLGNGNFCPLLRCCSHLPGWCITIEYFESVNEGSFYSWCDI